MSQSIPSTRERAVTHAWLDVILGIVPRGHLRSRIAHYMGTDSSPAHSLPYSSTTPELTPTGPDVDMRHNAP